MDKDKICISIVVIIAIIVSISGINMYNYSIEANEALNAWEKDHSNIWVGHSEYYEQYRAAGYNGGLKDVIAYYKGQETTGIIFILLGPIIIVVALIVDYWNKRENAKYRTYQMKCPHCGKYFNYESKHGALDISDFESYDNYNFSGIVKTGTTTYYCPYCNRSF